MMMCSLPVIFAQVRTVVSEESKLRCGVLSLGLNFSPTLFNVSNVDTSGRHLCRGLVCYRSAFMEEGIFTRQGEI